MSKNIAVVILNWNGKKLLEQFLPSVIANSQQATIYVADNASTDNSVSYIKEYFPQVIIIQNKQNGGYAKGYNDALNQLNEDIFCLLNSDVEVTPNWLNPILNAFEHDHNTAIIQPKILDFKQKNLFEYAGAAGGFIDKYGYAYCRGRIFNSIEKDVDQYKNASIFWASGACLFITNETFVKLNGFDESFFAHYEEIDLCWRAFNKGYDIKCITNSIVYHVGGATLNSSDPQKTYLNFRNSLFTITKNAHGNLYSLIFIRLVLDGIAAFNFLLAFKLNHVLSIFKAHLSFYAQLPKLLNLRKELPQKKNYYQKRSIVWAYFLSKRKTFTRL